MHRSSHYNSCPKPATVTYAFNNRCQLVPPSFRPPARQRHQSAVTVPQPSPRSTACQAAAAAAATTTTATNSTAAAALASGSATVAATAAGSTDIIAAANEQALQLLEWPAVCKQVASFCGTSMAAEHLLSGRLPIGRSQAESELLLQQTQEAADLGLEVSGVFDLRPALAAAAAGGVLNPRQLEGVAASMEAAFQLKAEVSIKQQQQQQQQQGGRYMYPSLADIAAGIPHQEWALLKAIRSCISDGTLVSAASEELSVVRTARSANKEAARTLVTTIARQLHAKGAAEGREPLLLRGRYCVAVRTNQRSALTKGSVKLGASGTGATLYMEPAEVLDLNNTEALLAEQESAAEIAVLSALSHLLSQRGAAIQGILDAVAALDIIAARAKHASWLDAVRPVFQTASSSSSSADGSMAAAAVGLRGRQHHQHQHQHQQQQQQQHRLELQGQSPMCISGARHPLLMQAALPPLPRPPSVEDAAYESDFVPPPLWATAAAGSSSSSSDTDDDDDSSSQAQNGVQGLRPQPKALDLRVPQDVTVVAITGPNTGGKTVTLKTAGLCALMAKAGLYLPIDRDQLAAAAAAAAADFGSSSSSSSSQLNPSLLWFDQVLADIGDAQSLQQNLSTFSGHIRRLKLLLAAAGPGSLVLLDEVGSGTDPLEGAALARAVLDVLAGQARLTMATSHHAELKTAADEDPRYVNVSMEFNTLTLKPTYKLCWGSAGSSNALDIAQALGFDSKVLAEARILARAQSTQQQQQQQQRGTMEKVASSIEAQLAAARESAAALNAVRQQREKQAEAYRDKTRQLMGLRNKLKGRSVLVDREQAEIVLQVQQAAKGVRRNEADLADVQSVIDFYQQKVTAGSNSSDNSGSDDLKPGDEVIVPSLLIPDAVRTAEQARDAVGWMKFKVTKVLGEDVWVDHALISPLLTGPRLSNRASKGIRVPRSKVIRAEQIQIPQEGLAGLAGYDSQQAAAEQQIIEDADSMLAGKLTQQQLLQQQQQEEEEEGEVSQQQMEQKQQAVTGQKERAVGVPAEQQKQKQQRQKQAYVWVEQSSRNTLDVEGLVPEAAVDEVMDVIQAHQAQLSSSSSNSSGDAQSTDQTGQCGLQEFGGSGFLEGGVLYVQHGVGTGAVKRAVLRCLAKQQDQGLVRRVKPGSEGAAAGRSVVWLMTL